MTERLWTPQDVADYLAVSITWVRRQIRGGALPALRVGRFYRFTPAAIRAWAEEHRHPLPAPDQEAA